jgi:hypothetical protein
LKILTVIKRNKILIIILFLTAILYSFSVLSQPKEEENGDFLAQRSFEDVEFQVSLGPRIPGSQAHERTIDWIIDELDSVGWEVEVQRLRILDKDIKNVVAKRTRTNLDENPWIILGAHYDSRLFADQDQNPENRFDPVLGANDGASGVAVLLEIGRILPDDLNKNVWLVFFDAEDNGNIPGWDWALGSQAFVSELDGKPDAVVIVDMVGDADLNLFLERNSNQDLAQEIWAIAGDLSYSDEFIPTPKYKIIDDHLPFINAGIAAVDIIDFDYPYWHTVEDTVDKVSPRSLKTVGDVLLAWLLK